MQWYPSRYSCAEVNLVYILPDPSRHTPSQGMPCSVITDAPFINHNYTYDGEFATPRSHTGQVVTKVLLLLSLHMYDTHRLRELTDEGNSDEWMEFKTAFFARIGNFTVAASMILATTASFLTTTPISTVADWSHPWPYASIGLAFLFTDISVGAGVFVLFIGMDLRPKFVCVSRLSHHSAPWMTNINGNCLVIPRNLLLACFSSYYRASSSTQLHWQG